MIAISNNDLTIFRISYKKNRRKFVALKYFLSIYLDMGVTDT